KRDARIRHIDDDIDLIDIEPRTSNARSDIWLVLMIAADDLNLDALGGRAEILDREFCRRYRARAANVGIKARQVAQDADLDDAVGILRKSGGRRQKRRHCDQVACRFHAFPPCRAGGPSFGVDASSPLAGRGKIQTPRYSCSLSRLASNSGCAKPSTT